MLRLLALLHDSRLLAYSLVPARLDQGELRLKVDGAYWLIAKFSEGSGHEIRDPTQRTIAELKMVFEYVGLPYVEPKSKDDFDQRVSLLRNEVLKQSRYLFELSKSNYENSRDEYPSSKFVDDIINLNRRR